MQTFNCPQGVTVTIAGLAPIVHTVPVSVTGNFLANGSGFDTVGDLIVQEDNGPQHLYSNKTTINGTFRYDDGSNAVPDLTPTDEAVTTPVVTQLDEAAVIPPGADK